jgi:hypothetical protein
VKNPKPMTAIDRLNLANTNLINWPSPADDILQRIRKRKVEAARIRSPAPVEVDQYVLLTEVSAMSLFFDWMLVRVSSVGESSFGYNLASHQEEQKWFYLPSENTIMFTSITAVFKDIVIAEQARSRLVAMTDEMEPMIEVVKLIGKAFPTSFNNENDMLFPDNILSETRVFLESSKDARQRLGTLMKIFAE